MNNFYRTLVIVISAVCSVPVTNAAQLNKKALAQNQAIQALCDTTDYEISSVGVVLNNNGKKDPPKLFFIKNNSDFSIWVDKANKGTKGLSAGWASEIEKHHWSALLLAEDGQFKMYCSRTIGNRQKLLDCKKFITVCHATQVKYNDTPNGGYWATENQKAKDFLPALEKRGIAVSVR